MNAYAYYANKILNLSTLILSGVAEAWQSVTHCRNIPLGQARKQCQTIPACGFVTHKGFVFSKKTMKNKVKTKAINTRHMQTTGFER